jgi:hypothetical protein
MAASAGVSRYLQFSRFCMVPIESVAWNAGNRWYLQGIQRVHGN